MAWSEAARAQHGRPHDDRQDDLTDAERALIAPLIPTRGRMGRPRATDPRRVFDAIRSMPSSGCRWRIVPPCHPPSSTVRNCFDVWRNDGTLERRPDALRALARAQAGRGVAPTGAIIDSQSVKTTESGGPSGYDAGKKIRGRKQHIAVDVEGNPIVVHVHPADVQDRDGAPDVIVDLPGKARGVSKVFADGGYRGSKLRDRLKDLTLPDILEIVGKPKETAGFTVIRRRWVVARTFAWMGRCRRLARDFERSLESSLAWVQLAACRFLMRRVARGTRA